LTKFEDTCWVKTDLSKLWLWVLVRNQRCPTRSLYCTHLAAFQIVAGKFLLRFGNKVVLCDKKKVRVHEWKRLADRVAGAAQNAIEIGEFAQAIANCRIFCLPDQFSPIRYVDDNSCLLVSSLPSIFYTMSSHLHIRKLRNGYTVPTLSRRRGGIVDPPCYKACRATR
jgi:hypothetical protein